MNKIAILVASLRTLVMALTATGAADSARAQSVDGSEAAAWSTARALNSAEAYQRYLEQFPVGPHAKEAFRNIVELSIDPESTQGAQDVEPSAGPEGGSAVPPAIIGRDLY